METVITDVLRCPLRNIHLMNRAIRIANAKMLAIMYSPSSSCRVKEMLSTKGKMVKPTRSVPAMLSYPVPRYVFGI